MTRELLAPESRLCALGSGVGAGLLGSADIDGNMALFRCRSRASWRESLSCHALIEWAMDVDVAVVTRANRSPISRNALT